MPRAVTMSRSSLALDNLRAVVILIVLAFHSVLAYVQWIPPRTVGFNDPPYQWRSFPILDSHRWFGFDLFCAWQDVYLMSLMFLLSGLFVWPSLARKRNWRFVRDRLLRLGVPFVFGIIVLVPVAIYPVYLVSATNPSVPDYIDHYLALPFVHNGQLWFLWQLLALNIVAVGINWIAPNALPALGRWAAAAGKRPGFFFAVLVAVTAVAYVPLALIFTPMGVDGYGLPPPAALSAIAVRRVFFHRDRDRGRGYRLRPRGGGRPVAAALGVVACCGARFACVLDGRDILDPQWSGAGRHPDRRRSEFCLGLRLRLLFLSCRQLALWHQTLSHAGKPFGQRLQPLSRSTTCSTFGSNTRSCLSHCSRW